MLMRTLRQCGANIRHIAGTIFSAVCRAQRYRAAKTMLHLDERLLWDIGLTRADVAGCLSSPWESQVEALFARQARKSEISSRLMRHYESMAA